jgi:hypothetical protein
MPAGIRGYQVEKRSFRSRRVHVLLRNTWALFQYDKRRYHLHCGKFNTVRGEKTLSLRFPKIYKEMSGLQNNQPHKKRMNTQINCIENEWMAIKT